VVTTAAVTGAVGGVALGRTLRAAGAGAAELAGEVEVGVGGMEAAAAAAAANSALSGCLDDFKLSRRSGCAEVLIAPVAGSAGEAVEVVAEAEPALTAGFTESRVLTLNCAKNRTQNRKSNTNKE
jgi:hypothetical protein